MRPYRNSGHEDTTDSGETCLCEWRNSLTEKPKRRNIAPGLLNGRKTSNVGTPPIYNTRQPFKTGRLEMPGSRAVAHLVEVHKVAKPPGCFSMSSRPSGRTGIWRTWEFAEDTVRRCADKTHGTGCERGLSPRYEISAKREICLGNREHRK